MNQIFEDNEYYTGPTLDDKLVGKAEQALGFRLPRSYVQVLSQRNGGVPRKRCFAADFPTSWAPDHIEIEAIRGIEGEWGIDSSSGLGSPDMIAEWGYPEIGIVICVMPSGGHDTIMLDYSEVGPGGEPSVAYIDDDRIPRRIASSFQEFLERMKPCEHFTS
ncbi:SMI1/KNR4 family protein [Nonomuraea turkmeniaca]|uniref:SMI1/KNR4 family protein n=1 Tax=Nonomuraea turkmeniaca TaxID=103838 RepID=A0A5S4F664_9ACTN|nr:SMI1/KNR4 family protein [Nonomuraea turkmeniaca]